MTDFKQLIKLIQDAVDNFQKVVPGIQRDMLDRLREELAGLKIKGGTIQVGAENVRKIAAIKAKLQSIVLTDEYKAAVKDYLKTFAEVTKLQNAYFKGLEKKFKPPAVGDMLQKQAVLGVLQNLTERGIETNVLSGIEDILRKNITTGGSYSELQRALENNLIDNETGDGSLTRYSKQITTDALNQHSAQYTQLIASDLGLEWFKYSGSNINTTRPFCLAMVEKKWIHISEFPAILRGDFDEFRKYDGKLYKGLPAGMIPDTTPANFPINRGGYNCGHQLRPVNQEQVPEDVREALGQETPLPVQQKPKDKPKRVKAEEIERLIKKGTRINEPDPKKVAQFFNKEYPGFEVPDWFEQVHELLAPTVAIELSKSIRIFNDGFNVAMEGGTLTFSRQFSKKANGDRTVYHDYFVLPKDAQGKGLAKEVFKASIEQYVKAGIKEITVFAALDGGGYTWARHGFVCTTKSEVLSILYKAERNLPPDQFQPVKEVYYAYYSKNPDGDAFPMIDWADMPWMKPILRGTAWHGKVDLTNKQQFSNFVKYVYGKK